MSSSRSRAGSLPPSSLPPNGSHFLNRPGWRTSVPKMFDAKPVSPPTRARSSRDWSSRSASASGSMRGWSGLGSTQGKVAFGAVSDLTPEEPHEAGVPERTADASHEEGARILADQARERLKDR